MIPIAGSAYTYTYATLGELIAWIIGWDLILEYAFSNMSVSVGFAAHRSGIARLDWDPAIAEVAVASLSAAWFAGSTGQGHLFGWMACRIQYSGVPYRAAADGSAGARHSGVGANQQHHGAGEDCGDPAVRLLRYQLYSSGELSSLLAEWVVRACLRAVRSSSLRTSGSIRSRRPARSAAGPGGMCRSEFWRRC